MQHKAGWILFVIPAYVAGLCLSAIGGLTRSADALLVGVLCLALALALFFHAYDRD